MDGEVVKCADCGEFLGVHAYNCPQAVPVPVNTSRREILAEAAQLIDGQRAKDYGDAKDNFARIAVGWSEILQSQVTAAQVALCMDWLKTCRLITSPDHRDSWIDKAGYVGLGGEIALS